jgi:hypothetical protein
VSAFRLSVCSLLLGWSLCAHAQTGQWNPYSTTVYREGPGVRLGTTALVLHPGVAIEGGYDSNVFFMPDNSVGAGLLRIRAHLDLATLPQQRMEGDAGTADPKVDFRLSTQVEYREYLSSEAFIQSQRSVNVFLSGDLGILPRGPFTLRISDTYVRTVDPRNLAAIPPASASAQVGQFSRNYNRAGVLGTYRSASSRFEFGLGDHVDLNLWENSDIAQFGDMINNEAQAFFRVRFLPQTIGTVMARVGYTLYFNTPQFEAIPVRLTAGISSLITTWFGVGASIGYGGSFHRAAGVVSFNSVIANLEARFFLPKGSRLTLGYDRDFFDSLLSGWYSDDRLFLAFDQPVVKRLTAHLDGGVRFRHYEGLRMPMDFGYLDYSVDGVRGATTRDDIIWDLHAELSVRATSWLAFAASYNLVGNTTGFAFVPVSGQPISAGYIKHSAFLRVDFAY